MATDDHSEDPWPAMREAMIERLKGTPPVKAKPDYRELYLRRKEQEWEKRRQHQQYGDTTSDAI